MLSNLTANKPWWMLNKLLIQRHPQFKALQQPCSWSENLQQKWGNPQHGDVILLHRVSLVLEREVQPWGCHFEQLSCVYYNILSQYTNDKGIHTLCSMSVQNMHHCEHTVVLHAQTTFHMWHSVCVQSAQTMVGLCKLTSVHSFAQARVQRPLVPEFGVMCEQA